MTRPNPPFAAAASPDVARGIAALRTVTERLAADGVFGEGLGRLAVPDLLAASSPLACAQALTTLRATRQEAYASLVRALEDSGFGPDLAAVGDVDRDAYPPIFALPVESPPALLAGGLLAPEGGTIYFGDGGAGKSWGALLVATTIALGDEVPVGHEVVRGLRAGRAACPVLYVDYEHRRRANRARAGLLARSIGYARPGLSLDLLPLFYHDPEREIWREIGSLRRAVRKLGVGLVVIDSAGFATLGYQSATRAGNGEEVPIAYFALLAELEVPTLSLAHVTKAEGDQTKPYGSVYWHNASRLTWQFRKGASSTDAVHVAELTNRKANDFPLADPQYLSIDRTDPASVHAEVVGAPLLEPQGASAKVERYLRDHGSARVLDIAYATELSAKTVESALSQFLRSSHPVVERRKVGRAYEYRIRDRRPELATSEQLFLGDPSRYGSAAFQA